MKLNELRDNPGARKSRMRVGRGIGSGKGKTAGTGHKGQKSRTGVSIGGFEGGQASLLKRMPKRGFNNPNAKVYAEVTLKMLQVALDSKKIAAGKTIDAALLKETGVISRIRDGIRLIGNDELKGKLTLVVTGATKGAIALVEKAGGSVEVLPAKVNKLLKEGKVTKKQIARKAAIEKVTARMEARQKAKNEK